MTDNRNPFDGRMNMFFTGHTLAPEQREALGVAMAAAMQSGPGHLVVAPDGTVTPFADPQPADEKRWALIRGYAGEPPVDAYNSLGGIDTAIRRVEEAANAKLAEATGPVDIGDLLADIIPEGWEYELLLSVGRDKPQVVITKTNHGTA